jgi:hypothetical protein
MVQSFCYYLVLIRVDVYRVIIVEYVLIILDYVQVIVYFYSKKMK